MIPETVLTAQKHKVPKNMLIPPEIIIGSQKISVTFLVLCLSLFYWVFIVWYEGRKDGFDSEKILDLAFTSLITSALFYLIYSGFYKYISTYYPNSLILKLDYQLLAILIILISSLLPVFFLSNRWNWSKYRLLDIYAVGFSQLVFLVGLGNFLVYKDLILLGFSVVSIALYMQVFRFRGYRFSSGVMFVLFLVFIAVFGLIFMRRNGSLLIYSVLFILSFGIVISRRNKSVYKRNLPAEFIGKLKSILVAKDKKLKDTQQLLVNEDPYLQTDRSTGNAEEMDEAILEDYEKNVNDAEKSIVKTLRIQVKKALAAIRLGKYGICEVCGKPIDRARLQAYPEATTCIECSMKASQNEGNEQV